VYRFLDEDDELINTPVRGAHFEFMPGIQSGIPILQDNTL